MFETRIKKGGQTTIPSEYRKEYNLTNDDIVEWKKNEKGEIIVSFRKKVTIDEMIGTIKTKDKTDSVELVRSIYNE
ncbi:MAG: AbrB/MazE/SpoVT family DNA-binding domain-containing protein [Methanosphaera sp.]|nr:AbrB/MazE/SpoVT family DNA-binding domain-containing protein [Methanosphaera sp.]